jgi:ligand-binding sensor domain-containing protein
MLEDRAGDLWIGVDDGLFLFKDGHFRRLPEPNHQRLGSILGITEDIENIWAECFGNSRKLVRIRGFEVQEGFLESQVPAGHTIAADPHAGIWIGTLKGDLTLFRNGVVQNFPLSATGDVVSRQIIANADGSVLAGSADGLVGLRNGKLQRMRQKTACPATSSPHSFTTTRSTGG